MHKLIYWGTPLFAVPALQALIDAGLVTAVVTQPGKPHGRGRTTIEPSPVQVVAEQAHIPILAPLTLKETAFRAALEQLLPATFMVVAYGKIIPEDILALSELPAINIHPSLLPLYRGLSPIQSVLAAGETQTALTLMALDVAMDHGPILAQKKVSIVPTDTFVSLSDKLRFTAEQFVMKYVPLYLAGELKPVTQDHNRATYCKKVTPEDGMLDFTQTVTVCNNKIRAYNPWPGAYCIQKGKRIKIISATPHAGRIPYEGSFGTLADGHLGISCSDGYLNIMTVQQEGKQAMNSADFLRGNSRLFGW